ncbi:serine/threonine-protein kinase [Streptomyces pactum]|uniref:serine/threonine-protein kinase n=1 Tax=Streptomyces pactum TaxID=68249 RepID=UPI0027DB9F36|nr:serine/threonine-protein kinase [Streptomyces pactum]
MRTTSVGDVIADRYVVRELIGRGGMGSVWRAEDTRLGRQSALKQARAGDARAARRLRREASNAARLHHPHIVTVFDILDDGADTWLVMEYVPSRSLAQLAEDEGGRLTPDRAAAVGRQIADALAHAHGEGVVHGDVTPENILVTAAGVAKLTDFGISRALRQDASYSFTGGLRGKPRYLPPEVANGERATYGSDLFGLGATLYAAVEGRSPYGEAEDVLAYVWRAAQGRIEPPRRAGPLTGPLRALLAPEPDHRPGAAETRELLAGIAQASPGPAESPRRPRPGRRDGHARRDGATRRDGHTHRHGTAVRAAFAGPTGAPVRTGTTV